MMIIASLSALAVDEEHPDTRGEVREIVQLYRTCCVQSLWLSNFTKPGPHTIETLIIHMEGEFIWNKANPVQFYLLAGNTVRLALRMGLHRDPSKVRSNITAFQGEMRRRIWNQLIQAELLSTFHIELPGMCSTIDSDTLSPRNLRDTDFDETSTFLPPSRPDTELTPISYAIWKGILCKISGKISTLANRLELPNYSEVMELDRQLHEAYAKVPPHFLQSTSALSVTDPPDSIIKRLSIALIFEKSRCMLHRRYLTQPRGEFDYSKSSAIDTSMKVLRLQSLVHEAFLPGGPLCRDRWFLSALSMHDFLVAGMILYLSLIQSLDKRFSASSHPLLDAQRQKIIELLKRSYEIWSQTDNMSAEMKRASRLVGTLLKNLNVNEGQHLQSTGGPQANGTLTMHDTGAFISDLSISGN